MNYYHWSPFDGSYDQKNGQTRNPSDYHHLYQFSALDVLECPPNRYLQPPKIAHFPLHRSNAKLDVRLFFGHFDTQWLTEMKIRKKMRSEIWTWYFIMLDKIKWVIWWEQVLQRINFADFFSSAPKKGYWLIPYFINNGRW